MIDPLRFSERPAECGANCVVDPTARFGPACRLGDGVVVEPYAVLHADVTLGDGCHVGSHAVLGCRPSGLAADGREEPPPPCRIGAGADIGPAAIIECGVTIGEELRLSGQSTVRQGSAIGRRFRAESYCDVRGDCRIGDYVTFYDHVHVSRDSAIGSFCWLMPYVILLNDRYPPLMLEPEGARIGDYSVIGTSAVIFPGVKLGRHVVVGAGSQVTASVGDYQIVSGRDSKVVGDARAIPCKLGNRYIRPYPWMKHVAEGFPWEGGAPPA